MNTTRQKYLKAEMLAVAPFTVKPDDIFKLKIMGSENHATKWLNITGEQFKAIEKIIMREMS